VHGEDLEEERISIYPSEMAAVQGKFRIITYQVANLCTPVDGVVKQGRRFDHYADMRTKTSH